MTQSTAKHHYDDENMILQLSHSDYLSNRAKKALANYDVVFVADLLQKTENELLLMHNFGQKSLNEVKELLESLSSNGKLYELSASSQNGRLFKGNVTKIKEYYRISQPNAFLCNPVEARNEEDNSMLQYAQRAFTDVSAYIEDDNVIYAFTLSEEFANLISDGHIDHNSNDFITAFFNHSLCDSPSFAEKTDQEKSTIELAYTQTSYGGETSGLLKLAHVNPRQGFIDAVAALLPTAIEKAETNWRARYGFQELTK